MIEIYLISLSFSSGFLKSKYFWLFHNYKSLGEKPKDFKDSDKLNLEIYLYAFNFLHDELNEIRKI